MITGFSRQGSHQKSPLLQRSQPLPLLNQYPKLKFMTMMFGITGIWSKFLETLIILPSTFFFRKRFKVRHQVVFDGNEIGEDELDGSFPSIHQASNRKRRRHVVLKTKIRRRRRRKRAAGSDEEDEKKSSETVIDVHQDSGENDEDWLNVVGYLGYPRVFFKILNFSAK